MMNSRDNAAHDPLKQQIDSVRGEFVQAWRAGACPRIEDHLTQIEAAARDDLLRDLIVEEVRIRRDAGDVVHLSDYESRFTGQPNVVLEAFREAGMAWDYPATEVGSGTVGSPPMAAEESIQLGNQRGRFRVVRLHAKGGLGKVSIAVDEELHREVALKEIQEAHAGSESNRRRFTLEAEITGRLEHPGVVPVYGLGTDPLGRPFYAMRLIRGDTLASAIREFHDGRAASADFDTRMQFRHLLARFVATCNAIHYAHSRGVIHRDLKPGNIMLGSYGETHVVDWGLAKVVGATDDDTLEATLPHESGDLSDSTKYGSAVGTPAYMSPEQAAGKIGQLGPRSDVYCLGATLYSLITGSAPISKTDLPTALRRVQEGDIPRPRRISPHVPRGLEAICLQAMAVRPEDRYSTASALAADIEHWLADEAVTARKDSVIERCARWMRRHRTWARATAASLFVITLVSLAASLVVHRFWREAERQRIEAQDSFQQARQAVDDYFTRVSQERLLDEPGMQALRRDLLALALDYYSGFVAERSDDPTLRLALGQNSFRIGLIQDQIGNAAESRAAYEQACRILESLDAADQSRVTRAILARAKNNLGLQQREAGDYAAADRSFARARALRERLVAEQPDDPIAALELSKTYRNIGAVLLVRGESARSLDWYQKSIDALTELSARHPSDPDINEQLAATLSQVAIQQRTTDVDQAAHSIDRAIALLSNQLAANPDSQLLRRRVANLYMDLSRLAGPRRAPRSIPAIENAVRLQEELVQENPRVEEYAGELARICDWAAWVLHQNQSDPTVPQALERSYEMSRRSTELLRNLSGTHPESIRYKRALVNSLNMNGLIERDRQNIAPGLDAFDDALQVITQLIADNPDAVALGNDAVMTYHNKGRLLEQFDRDEEALETYLKERNMLAWMVEQDPANAEFRFRHANVFPSLAAIECRLHGSSVAARRMDELTAIIEMAVSHQQEYFYAMACVGGLCAQSDAESRPRYVSQALDALERAVEHGYDDFDLMRSDDRLELLRQDPRFVALLKQ